MYKTIRHGENSLQYTILPQNDDIRMDGKLTSASSSSNNNNNSISNLGTCQSIKRGGGKNKSFYAYLGLLFVCTVIIGAILIPFLVSAECLQNPSDWFLKTRVAFTGHINNNFNTTSTTISVPLFDINNNNNIKISNNNQSTNSTINKSYPNGNNIELGLNDYIPTTIPTIINNTASKKQKKIKNNYNNNLIVNKQILNKNNNDVYKKENDITESDLNNDNDKINYENNEIEQTTKDSLISNAILISIQQNNKKQQQKPPKELIANNKFNSGIEHSTNIPLQIIMTTEDSLSSESGHALIETISEISTISSNYLTNKKLIPSLSPISVTKKPIILAVLSKTNSVISENGKIIPKHNESKNWIKSHWPFIDPSTYFQWTGYKSEDSVILPAILGITLIGTIFTLTLCLVARNKRKIVASVRKRKRNHIDGTGEDNATLLTIANLSDADDE